jgi:hypothetical protein
MGVEGRGLMSGRRGDALFLLLRGREKRGCWESLESWSDYAWYEQVVWEDLGVVRRRSESYKGVSERGAPTVVHTDYSCA